MKFEFLAQRLFNVPLAIHPAKAEVVIAALSERLGIVQVNSTMAAGYDEMFQRGGNSRDGYQIVEGVAIIPVVAIAVRGLTAVLLANPILAIIAGIAFAAYLIYENWEPIKQFFADLWDEIKDAFKGGIGGVTKLIINWSPVGLFYRALKPVFKLFGIDLPPKFTDFGKQMIDSLVRGIKGESSKVVDEARRAGEGVSNALKNGASGGVAGGLAAGMTGMATGMFAPFNGKVSQSGKTAQSETLFAGLEQKYGLPKGLLDGTWRTESGRGKNMKSSAGAEGHFQFMPQTAARFGLKNPYDLSQSADASARYFKYLFKLFKGNAAHAVTAYNWGEGNMLQYLKTGRGAKGQAMPRESREYAGKVMAEMGPAREVAINQGVGRTESKEKNPPLEITLNAPPGYTATAKRSDGTVVPVKVNYAMSSQFQ